MKKSDYLNKIYEKNPDTGNYIIEISLDKYSDIFNEWDHASYKKRDLDPELARFLEDCSMDIPIKYGLDVCFYLPKEIQDKEKEKIIINGLKTFYSFYIHWEHRNLKESYSRIFSYILISFLLLSLGYLINVSKDDVLLNTLMQGMNVGGWVFLWEAISLFFFKRGEVLGRVKKYKRFASSKIIFKYSPPR
jgi:hypothetical protein